MKRIAVAVLALAAPLFAQDKVANEAENTFYKAFYLERGERRYDEAVELYRQFLAAAPEHRYAPVAARQALQLLQRMGKREAADKFAAAHQETLGRGPGEVAAGAEPPAAEPGRRGGRRGARGADQPGERGPAANAERIQQRLAQLKERLTQAKEEGDEAAVARLEEQIKTLEAGGGRGPRAGRGQQGGGGGRGARGQGGGGGRRGLFGGEVKFAEMSEEQMTQFIGQLDRMEGFVDRIRERGDEARAKEMETGIAAVRKALAEKKFEDAQKAWNKLATRRRR